MRLGLSILKRAHEACHLTAIFTQFSQGNVAFWGAQKAQFFLASQGRRLRPARPCASRPARPRFPDLIWFCSHIFEFRHTYLLTKDPHGQTGTDVAQAHCVRPHMSRRSTRRRHSHIQAPSPVSRDAVLSAQARRRSIIRAHHSQSTIPSAAAGSALATAVSPPRALGPRPAHS